MGGPSHNVTMNNPNADFGKNACSMANLYLLHPLDAVYRPSH
jgi:hypothetical protein